MAQNKATKNIEKKSDKSQQRVKMPNSKMLKASRQSHWPSVLCLRAQLIGYHSAITFSCDRTASVLFLRWSCSKTFQSRVFNDTIHDSIAWRLFISERIYGTHLLHGKFD
jgi:hypothetical protein